MIKPSEMPGIMKATTEAEEAALRHSQNVEQPLPCWECPRCKFNNLVWHSRCVECRTSRPITVPQYPTPPTYSQLSQIMDVNEALHFKLLRIRNAFEQGDIVTAKQIVMEQA